jgi:hypothetical protein
MRTFLLLLLVFLHLHLRAEDALLPGGRSPDGKLELRVFRNNNEPSNYDLRLCPAGGSVALFNLDAGGGYLGYEAALERDHVLWHSSGQFFALTDQGTRHTVELHVFAFRDGKLRRLTVPDYVQNALGRIRATEIEQSCVTTLLHWTGDELLLKLDFSANQRRLYTCRVTLHLFHGPDSEPTFALKKVTNPRESEN